VSGLIADTTPTFCVIYSRVVVFPLNNKKVVVLDGVASNMQLRAGVARSSDPAMQEAMRTGLGLTLFAAQDGLLSPCALNWGLSCWGS
jgi:hypothetical protein